MSALCTCRVLDEVSVPRCFVVFKIHLLRGSSVTIHQSRRTWETKHYTEENFASKKVAILGTIFGIAVASAKEKNIFHCLETVMQLLVPYRFVKKEYARIQMEINNICLESLWKYMLDITEVVHGKIKRLRTHLFSLVFDGWPFELIYIAAIFSSFSTDIKNRLCSGAASFLDLWRQIGPQKRWTHTLCTVYSSVLQKELGQLRCTLRW